MRHLSMLHGERDFKQDLEPKRRERRKKGRERYMGEQESS